LFANTVDSDPAARHFVVASICCPGTLGHDQLLAFLDGEELLKLPTLANHVGRLRFASVTERWVESLHATAKQILKNAKHMSAVHLAFGEAHLALRQLLRRRPEAVHELARHCGTVRNVCRALQMVGLWNHLVVSEVRRLEGRRTAELGRSCRPKLVEVIYHVDRETLFKSRIELQGTDSHRVVVWVMQCSVLFCLGKVACLYLWPMVIGLLFGLCSVRFCSVWGRLLACISGRWS
jgi:hypothetical protein